jgi:adenylate cyclase
LGAPIRPLLSNTSIWTIRRCPTKLSTSFWWIWAAGGPPQPALRVVRVRIAGESASLTVKGVASGLARPEFEYAIPRSDAEFLLEQLCIKPLIEKTRYREVVGGDRWDIDVFHGDNDGLIVAELEVAREGEPFRRPSWIGREVSTDPRYFNANLVANPYARRRND